MSVVARQSVAQKALAQAMTRAVISEDYAALKRHVDADAGPCLPACLSVRPSACLSVCMLACLPVWMSDSLSLSLSLCLCLSLSLSPSLRCAAALPDLELCEGSGWTPLILAAWYGQHDMLKLLVDAGASVLASDRNDWTACASPCVPVSLCPCVPVSLCLCDCLTLCSLSVGIIMRATAGTSSASSSC